MKQEPNWNGSLNCAYSGITSLEGSPKTVKTTFNCSHNELKNLKYAPNKIGGDFVVYNNPLKTIRHLKDTKGIMVLVISESKYMKKDDYLKEIFKNDIKFEFINIYDKKGIMLILDKQYKELKKEFLKIKYDIENF